MHVKEMSAFLRHDNIPLVYKIHHSEAFPGESGWCFQDTTANLTAYIALDNWFGIVLLQSSTLLE